VLVDMLRAARYGGGSSTTLGSTSSQMNRPDDWVHFRSFPERGAAEVLCRLLELEGVPCKIEAHLLENAIEAEYSVHVARWLAHRARWVAAQLPPTEEELTFLATGKLPSEE
jgi:hypothetical protein